MGTNEIVTIVSNLGFPIAMCVYMVYSNERVHKRYEKEVAKFTKVIQQVTTELARLTDRIEAELNDRKENNSEE